MAAAASEIVTDAPDDGGRSVTVSIPPDPAEVVVFAADGAWHVAALSAALDAAGEGTRR